MGNYVVSVFKQQNETEWNKFNVIYVGCVIAETGTPTCTWGSTCMQYKS